MEITSIEELNLRYIDEEAVRLLPSSYLNSYPQMPTNTINFDDAFDVDPSELDSKKQKSNFFSSSNIKNHKEQKPQLTVYLKQNLSNLKARRKTIHHIPPANLMKNVRNVALPNDYSELIQLFLNSNYFLYFIRLVVLINVVAIFLTQYSFRVHVTVAHQLSKLNVLSLCLQLFANCVFTLEIMMRLYQQQANYKQPYLIFNIVGTIATWVTIFFDMMKYDDNPVFTIMIMIRITRAIIRIMEVSQWLRTPFQVFIKTIPSLQKLFFPLIIIALFYALSGMALFSGSNHYICGEEHQTSEFSGKYCGSSMYTCPDHEKCTFISEQMHPQQKNQYNLIHFNNIGNALLTVYHFVYNSNFHVIRGKFSSFINPYISSVYFISMSIFFFYIFSNLIMISMSKAYMEQVQHKEHKQQPQIQPLQQFRQISFLQKATQVFNLIIIIVQSIVLAINFEGMSQSVLELQCLLDFSLSWLSLIAIFFMIALQKKQYFNKPLNCIDSFTLAFHFLDLIICASLKKSVIYNQSTSTLILRSLKVIRIIRIIYFSESLFAYQKYVMKVFVETVIKVKAFLLLCICFAFMFKQYGEVLFAYKIRFDSHGQVDIQNGIPYIHNFQSFSSSLYTILYLFLNEHWSQTMYQYFSAVGWPAVWFFVIVVFVAHMMLIRLYIAVFLSYFKEQLHKKSKQEHQKDSSNKLESMTQSQLKKSNEQIKNQESGSCKSKQISKAEQVVLDERGNDGCFMSVLSSFYHSNKFYFFINTAIFVHILTIIVRSSSDSQSKANALAIVQNICFAIYILQVVVGCLIEGAYATNQSYLRKNKSNVISAIVAIFGLVGYFPLSSQLAHLYIRRITILKIFTLFRQTDKQMSIVVDTIFNIMSKFFNFILIYTIFLFIIAIIPLKFLSNQSNLFNCKLPFYVHSHGPIDELQCLHLGGAWQQNQYFGNIFSSIALLYQIVSSQAWSGYIQQLIVGNKPFGWQIFFILFFFVYNICFLGIVMGFIVETYLHLKDQAYNLNLLKQSQRCWVLIKNSINILTPKPVIALPSKASSQRKLIFDIVTSDTYMTQLDIMAYINAALCVVTYNDESQLYSKVINYSKYAILFGFVFDVVLKLYALRKKYFQLSNSHIQFLSGIFIVLYSLASWIWVLNYEVQHILKFLLTAILLLRCKSLLLKYSWCKTHLNAVIDILPKCGKIIKLVCAVLFFYAAIGLQVFKYVKHDEFIDNYNIGFDDFLTAILSLVRVSIAEAWYEVVSAFLKTSTQYNHCYSLGEYELAKQHNGMGCGSWIAYPYFLSFHVVVVLLVMNLLIATMASAYDDNYQIQYNSVNIFQLEDCLNLWQKYDPYATGVVHYKKFWRLTSEIAILFGISKKKLIKRKNKFFQELDLQIYQTKKDPILCYRFHDVITKFSKIKLQVANLGHNQKSKEGDNEVDIEFDISPSVLKQIKDYITPFPDHLYSTYKPFKQYKSGETKFIFGLLKKIRHWKHVATEKKRPVGGAKLSSIFDLISKKNYNHDLAESDQIRVPEEL